MPRRCGGARGQAGPRRKPRKRKPFRRPRRFRPGRGRAEEADGDPLFAAGAGLALLDTVLRREPPFAGALRSRLALQSAAASAKILRVNADQGALRDLRFAVGDVLGPAAKLLALWRTLADRPPSLKTRRLAAAAAALDLPARNADALAETLREQSRAGDPVSARVRPLPWRFPPSRTPQRPKSKSSPFGCSTWSSRSGCAGPSPFR